MRCDRFWLCPESDDTITVCRLCQIYENVGPIWSIELETVLT